MEELLAGPAAIFVIIFGGIFAVMMMAMVFMFLGTIMMAIGTIFMAFFELFFGMIMLVFEFIFIILEICFLPFTLPGMIVSGLVGLFMTKRRTALRVTVVFVGTAVLTSCSLVSIAYLVSHDLNLSLEIGVPIALVAASINAFTSFLEFSNFGERMRNHLERKKR